MTKATAAQAIALPQWAMPDAPSRTALFEVAALAGFEGKWVRMSADDQRRVIGSAVFGRQAFCVNEDGTVTVVRSTCFGMDAESSEYEAGYIQKAVRAGKRLSPGVGGGRYYWGDE